MHRALFFDKDGVMNVDKGIDGTDEAVELYQGISDVVAYFRQKGFKIFVFTNQPIVARGLMTETKLIDALDAFKKIIASQNKEAVIEKVYYCPHHPNATVEKYRKICECRKPKPGMLLQAAQEFSVDLKKSYCIGDRISDVIAGHLAGCTTIQILSGKHDEKMIETDVTGVEHIQPDYVIHTITELKDIIV